MSNPGAYTVTSNATLFNVLYAVGEPTTAGSLRDVRIIRNGRVLRSVGPHDLFLDESPKPPLQQRPSLYSPTK